MKTRATLGKYWTEREPIWDDLSGRKLAGTERPRLPELDDKRNKKQDGEKYLKEGKRIAERRDRYAGKRGRGNGRRRSI